MRRPTAVAEQNMFVLYYPAWWRGKHGTVLTTYEVYNYDYVMVDLYLLPVWRPGDANDRPGGEEVPPAPGPLSMRTIIGW